MGKGQGAFTYGKEINMEMRDNKGCDEMIVKEAALSQQNI